jgi:hypothetical protein
MAVDFLKTLNVRQGFLSDLVDETGIRFKWFDWQSVSGRNIACPPFEPLRRFGWRLFCTLAY